MANFTQHRLSIFRIFEEISKLSRGSVNSKRKSKNHKSEIENEKWAPISD